MCSSIDFNLALDSFKEQAKKKKDLGKYYYPILKILIISLYNSSIQNQIAKGGSRPKGRGNEEEV